MVGFVRHAVLVVVFLAYMCMVYAADDTNNTLGTTDQIRVQLSNEATFGVCLYPASGSYSSLNRLLYYCTLVFSLLSRAHLWLVAGALTTALTYSGAAAVHACLIAWRGPNPWEDYDVLPLSNILGIACLFTVPLLNWSGTLRRLGATFANPRDKKSLKTQSSSGTRTIVVYWGFLVLIGYVCAWKLWWFADSSGSEYPDMSQVFCRPGTNASMFLSANGTSHRRAIDQDFISANRCNNPCDTIEVPAIFRQNSDLVLLPYKMALIYNRTTVNDDYETFYKFLEYENSIDTFNELLLLFILVQGFITACFGRRDPREIRDLIYIKLAMDHAISDKPILITIQEWTARFLAFFAYVMAVLMIIICPPLFIRVIIDQEWSTRYIYPDAEPMSSVGQWGPWAMTVQVVLAALISKYHDKVIGSIAKAFRYAKKRVRGHSSKQKYQEIDEQREQNDHTNLEMADIETAATLKVPGSVVSGELPTTASITKSTSEPTTATIFAITPTTDTPPPTKSQSQSLGSKTYKVYTILSSPINQNGKGLLDELQNFFAWCKDPAGISERVVRHPIRPADTDEMVLVDNNDDDDDEKGEAIVVSQPRRQSGFFRAASRRNPNGMNGGGSRGKVLRAAATD